MVKFTGFRPEHQKLFEDEKYEEIEQEVIPLLRELARFIEESRVLPFEIEKKGSEYLIGRGWVKKERMGLERSTRDSMDNWNLVWLTLKDKNACTGPERYLYENYVRGVLIFISEYGIELGAWEGYYLSGPKKELRDKIIGNVGTYLPLLKNFPADSLAMYAELERMFNLPSDAERLIKKIRKMGKKPEWLYLEIPYSWNKICSPEFPDILKGDIEKFLKPFWVKADSPTESGENKSREGKMTNEGIIEILKEEAGLDTKTLIFEPEKAEAFIEKADRNRIAFLPVKPDWNEAKKVFGYYNPLTGLFYPTDGLNVLLNAFRSLMRGEKDKKYFIILDEMNLARVEYYFSDILSLMENMWRIKEGNIQRGEVSQIHPILDACLLSKPNFPQDKVDQERAEKVCWLVGKEECSKCAYHPLLTGEKLEIKKDRDILDEVKECQPIPPRIAYPENLVIIGTVNVDETTFSFAPKVLDRAFLIEFTDVHYKKNEEKGIKKGYLELKGIEKGDFYNFVDRLQTILKTRNMHFGYRVIDEMLKYLKNVGKGEDKDFDFLLKSKVLPKFHGTEEQIGDILIKLLAFCAGKENYEVESKGKDKDQKFKEEILNEKDEEGNWWQFSFDKYKSIFEKYFESAQKLWQMYQNMKATGYCSYF